MSHEATRLDNKKLPSLPRTGGAKRRSGPPRWRTPRALARERAGEPVEQQTFGVAQLLRAGRAKPRMASDDRICRMNTTVRLRPALARQLGKIAAESNQDLSSLAENALAQFVRSHRETVHLTGAKANVRRLREAHAEIEAEIARRKRRAA